jgi:hypothetical protein
MRKYDGVNADRSMFDALKLVLKFVYVSHFKSGFEALQNMPKDPEIHKALKLAIAKNPLAAKAGKGSAASSAAASPAVSSGSGGAASSSAKSAAPKAAPAKAGKAAKAKTPSPAAKKVVKK